MRISAASNRDLHRRLLYEMAFTTGLSANELRSLTVEHLDLCCGVLHLDIEGIPKHAPEGKVDFHACRNAYISLLFEAGGFSKRHEARLRRVKPP